MCGSDAQVVSYWLDHIDKTAVPDVAAGREC